MHELTENLSRLLLRDLLIILTAGLLAGMLCKRMRIPMVIGHLAVGALIGGSFLNFLPLAEEPAGIDAPAEDGRPLETLIRENLPQDNLHGTEDILNDTENVPHDTQDAPQEMENREKPGGIDEGIRGNINNKRGDIEGLAEDREPLEDASGSQREGVGSRMGLPSRNNDSLPMVADTNEQKNEEKMTSDADRTKVPGGYWDPTPSRWPPEASRPGSNARTLASGVKTVLFERNLLEGLAHFGAILLLFAIGIQFSPSEITQVWKYFVLGGSVQMFGVILPLTLLFPLCGLDWKTGFVIGAAVSLSSTVLVFKSLEDMGHAKTSHGMRMVAILLFQDIAVVPLLLLLPMLGSARGNLPELCASVFAMLVHSLLFLALVMILRYLVCMRWVQHLAALRSAEILALFSVVLILAVCGTAVRLQLPAALGGLAAGVVLSENRLTHQISAITLPFRETFSAIFFVSLGAMFDYRILLDAPAVTLGAFAGLLTLKTLVGGLAFRLLGIPWKTAVALGLGMSQLGELSFVILSDAAARGMFSQDIYQQMLLIALVSLLMTPLFLRVAQNRFNSQLLSEGDESRHPVRLHAPASGTRNAIVVGLGPVGSKIVSFLELSGLNVCLVDMNPINLHPYAQEGFRTVAGDATNLSSLQLAEISECHLAVITVPDDDIAADVTGAVRAANPRCSIMVRCRYLVNRRNLLSAGANKVICEEAETGGLIIRSLEKLV
ncbi:MAG: cation:proton antiporter [Planctomycetaceae bacterium]|jgi:CPA2 family monovalent cation:H+ antiporter-2|nr:cation:proton antiporter [Planctomycetaceae bacterium]